MTSKRIPGLATVALLVAATARVAAFGSTYRVCRRRICLSMSDKDEGERSPLGPTEEVWDARLTMDSNSWLSSDEEEEDWEAVLEARKDSSYWSSFEPTDEERASASSKVDADPDSAAADEWLNTLASLSAEQTDFNMREAERADKVRQMEQWGFDAKTISNALGVATDGTVEADEEMESFRQAAYDYEDEVDWGTVESHTLVERDDETGEPVRQQMVYVDEHTCIGCTNCAMIAQSTFRMDEEHGRARVFQQWGDDDDTIQVAIQTCPVDCIHYVPYDELVKLEKERRNQNINFKARLVSQSEYGGGGAVIAGSFGANAFTGPQKISGNSKARCNNCPSRGCRNCPMFGVGKNPEFERREAERLAKRERKRMEQRRQEEKKSVDL